jgi:hypothetical protein
MKSLRLILARCVVVAACGSPEPDSSDTVASAETLNAVITVAPGNAVINDERFDITGAAGDGRPLRSVAFSIDGVQKAVVTTPPFTYRWQLTTAETTGHRTLLVTVTDTNGNVASATQRLTVLFRGCNVFVHGTSAPHGGTWGRLAQGQVVALEALCTAHNPASSVDFLIDGVLQVNDASPPYTFTTSTLPVGTHTIAIRAPLASGFVSNHSFAIEIAQAGEPPEYPSPLPDAAQAGVGVAPVPTFHSMSLYYNGNFTAASPPPGNQVFVRYRRATDDPNAPSFAWKQGHPMWYDTRTTGNALPYPWRGRASVVTLQPGAKYVFELGTGTSYAQAQWRHSLTGSTWSEAFPVGATVTIPSQSATYLVTQAGTPSAYRVYDGWNGNSRNVINRGGAGTTNANGVSDDSSHAIVIKASYVVVRRVRATGAAIAGIYVAPNVTDVIIEDSQIDDWSWRPGRTFADEPSNPNSWGTWGFNEAGGIYLGGNNSRIVMQRNTIMEPHFGAFPWDTGVGCNAFTNPPQPPTNHPIGPMGISIQQAGQQNVIRYNEITGHPTNRNMWYLDGIGGGENFSDRGVPGADSDIYQNILMHVFDDAIEAEGGGRNVRVWENYINDSKTAVATTTVHFGPTYVWRNVANRLRACYQQVADSSPGLDWPTTAFKYGGFDNGYGNGIRYLFHNTILQQTGAFGAGYGIEPVSNGAGSVSWTIARNNILQVRDETNFSWSVQSGDSPIGSDLAFNLYNGRYDTHLPPPDPAFRFTASQLFYRAGHGAFSVPSLGGGGAGNYQLDTGSKGLNACTPLPNFNDGFSGSAADCGAHEDGAPPMLFGITAN